MPTELVDLELGKVELLSVVDKGASGDRRHRPRIVLLKRQQREGGIMGLFDRIRKNVNETLDETLAAETEATGKGCKEVEKADDAQGAFLEMLETMGLSDEQKASLKMAFMSALAAQPPSPKPEPPPDAARQTTEVVRKPEDEMAKEEGPDVKDVDPEAKKETAEQAMAKRLDDMPEDIRKAFADMQARTEELEKQHAEDIAKRELGEQLEVAKRFPHVAGDMNQRAALLLSVKKTQGDKAYGQLVKVYEEAQRIAKAGGGLDELGTLRADFDADAETEFENEVKKIQKADGCTKQIAFKRAKQRNPELYAQTIKIED